MNKHLEAELISILRLFVYYDRPKMTDRKIKNKAFYAALAGLVESVAAGSAEEKSGTD